jgi:hypothetical protein
MRNRSCNSKEDGVPVFIYMVVGEKAYHRSTPSRSIDGGSGSNVPESRERSS